MADEVHSQAEEMKRRAAGTIVSQANRLNAPAETPPAEVTAAPPVTPEPPVAEDSDADTAPEEGLGDA